MVDKTNLTWQRIKDTYILVFYKKHKTNSLGVAWIVNLDIRNMQLIEISFGSADKIVFKFLYSK